mmetsp:Transcript_25103/g.45676  ORF Transcript_25103/g.45676 Transcript_25103/m.45676 type:complete len:483 (+) Transcript_25103:86-1534(+)
MFSRCCGVEEQLTALAEAKATLHTCDTDEGICQSIDELPPLFVADVQDNAMEAEVMESEAAKADANGAQEPEPAVEATPAAVERADPKAVNSVPETPKVNAKKDDGSDKAKSLEDEAGSVVNSANNETPDKRPESKAKSKAKGKAKNKVEPAPKMATSLPSKVGKATTGSEPAAKPAVKPAKSDILREASPRDSNAALAHDLAPESMAGKKMTLYIISAKGLASADWASKSDPYCQLQIGGSPVPKVKTSAIRNTDDPKWHEAFEVVYEVGKDLVFAVQDKDVAKDDSLGTARLRHQEYFPDGFNGDLLLSDPVQHANATIHVAVFFEERPLAITDIEGLKNFLRQKRTEVTVRILSAKGLRNADLTSKSDPYCTCQLSGMPLTKIHTKVLKNTLEPQWNSTFHFEHVPGTNLEFQVWDKDMLKKDDLLGKATLKEGAFYPNGFNGSLQLSESGKRATAATIDVEVEVHLGGRHRSLTHRES